MRCQVCALSTPSLGEWHAAVGLSCLTQIEGIKTVSPFPGHASRLCGVESLTRTHTALTYICMAVV